VLLNSGQVTTHFKHNSSEINQKAIKQFQGASSFDRGIPQEIAHHIYWPIVRPLVGLGDRFWGGYEVASYARPRSQSSLPVLRSVVFVPSPTAHSHYVKKGLMAVSCVWFRRQLLWFFKTDVLKEVVFTGIRVRDKGAKTFSSKHVHYESLTSGYINGRCTLWIVYNLSVWISHSLGSVSDFNIVVFRGFEPRFIKFIESEERGLVYNICIGPQVHADVQSRKLYKHVFKSKDVRRLVNCMERYWWYRSSPKW